MGISPSNLTSLPYAPPSTPARRAAWVVFFALALLLHYLLLHQKMSWEQSAPAPVEIRTVDPARLEKIRKKWNQKNQQLLLNENPADKVDLPPPDQARYMSDRNIRVEKEQRAKQRDVLPHPETNTHSAPPLKALGVPLNLGESGPKAAKSGPLSAERQIAQEDPLNQKQAHQNLLDSNLPEGSENLLNAQESVFYSFYARLYEAIGPLWQSDLRRTRPNRPLQPGNYQTTVDVVLDAQGNLVDVRLLQGSTIEAFDEVVFRSWKKIPRFPNPPKGLLDATGHVHMGWSFTVQIDSHFGLQYLPPERT